MSSIAGTTAQIHFGFSHQRLPLANTPRVFRPKDLLFPERIIYTSQKVFEQMQQTHSTRMQFGQAKTELVRQDLYAERIRRYLHELTEEALNPDQQQQLMTFLNDEFLRPAHGHPQKFAGYEFCVDGDTGHLFRVDACHENGANDIGNLFQNDTSISVEEKLQAAFHSAKLATTHVDVYYGNVGLEKEVSGVFEFPDKGYHEFQEQHSCLWSAWSPLYERKEHFFPTLPYFAATDCLDYFAKYQKEEDFYAAGFADTTYAFTRKAQKAHSLPKEADYLIDKLSFAVMDPQNPSTFRQIKCLGDYFKRLHAPKA